MLDGLARSPDPGALASALDEDGYALLPGVLTAADCARIRAYWDDPAIAFRSTVDMARHGFGRGRYRYFAYPLPADVAGLRQSFYALLAPLANDWAERLGLAPDWPPALEALTERCRAAGQARPTPLLLRYAAGDYNCLHQDLYGDIHFPLQVIVGLSDPRRDFSGGELVLVEQRPRQQSRASVVPLGLGDAAVIPVRERPRRGKRGWHRAGMRHGVSELGRGERSTLGLIFHDAA